MQTMLEADPTSTGIQDRITWRHSFRPVVGLKFGVLLV